MAQSKTPSATVYAELKRLGVSNHDAASVLMNTQLTFDGKPLSARIEESSQLSRRIVNTMPGEVARGLFRSFETTCPQLAQTIIEGIATSRFKGDFDLAAAEVCTRLTGPAADEMARSLAAFGIDDSIYRNMVAFIERAELPDEKERATLHLMMLVVTGCLGSPRNASIIVTNYVTEVVGTDFNTAQAVITSRDGDESGSTDEGEPLIGLVRVVDGRIKAGSNLHVLSPEGSEIGLLPESRHPITDVGEDASRRHAHVWREDGRWLIEDLGSTNGTAVVSGATGEETVLGEDPVEIAPTDLVRLGTQTCFMVMPVLGS